MDASWIDRDLAFAISAARDAGRRAMHLRKLARWEGKTLADVGDQACDGYLQGFVAGRYPDDGILSEETKDTPSRLEKERVWIIDPLDGTKEYSELRPDWAVHVALTIEDRCALGAVALPAQNRLLWGISLPGQERSGLEGPGTLVHGNAPAKKRLKIAVSRSHTPPWVSAFAQVMQADLAPAGSVGNKVCMLFTGEADLYVHKIGLKEWDTCAPEVLARALGWHVCKLRGEEHVYNRRDPKNHELVVCRPAQREHVLAALERAGALE